MAILLVTPVRNASLGVTVPVGPVSRAEFGRRSKCTKTGQK
jgi:hypothetical protein